MPAPSAETALQRHVRRRVDDAHRVAIDDLDAVERREQAARHRRDFPRQVLARCGADDLAGERQVCPAPSGEVSPNMRCGEKEAATSSAVNSSPL
jgi:hypothetical protein